MKSTFDRWELVRSKPIPRASIVVKTSLLLSWGSVQHKHLRSSNGLCHSILVLVSNTDWAKFSLKTPECILLQRFAVNFVYCLDRIVHEVQGAVCLIVFPLSPGSVLHRVADLAFEKSCICEFDVIWSVHRCDNWSKEEPTRCYLVFYCTFDMLNMFRVALCSSSGAHVCIAAYRMERLILGLLMVGG
jgi:hypothetical protein